MKTTGSDELEDRCGSVDAHVAAIEHTVLATMLSAAQAWSLDLWHAFLLISLTCKQGAI
jgi:hypothetical protein